MNATAIRASALVVATGQLMPSTNHQLMTIASPLPKAEIKLTCYDDGAACPAGCDPHVVAHKKTNGSAAIHDPKSVPDAWAACKRGAVCEVCARPEECVTVQFRGGGPA